MAIFLFFWQRFHWPKAVVSLKGENLQVLVADSIYRQQKGLGGRASISPFEGMVFPFSTLDKHAFIMRDMNFPIDIVWFDKNKNVTHMENVVRPDTYPKVFSSAIPSLYVLEIPAGFLVKNNIKIGDSVAF